MAGRNQNEELIEKTIETSDFLHGGALNPEQQDRFVVLVKKFSTLLPLVRFQRMAQPKMDIDKMHIGEPVTESADENEMALTTGKPKFNKIELITRKVRSSWNITTESLQTNIEQSRFEDSVVTAMTARIATDLEMLAIQGDVAKYTGGTDPVSKLLARLNGWDLKTEGAHVLDCGGNSIVKGIFAQMYRMMPKQYRNDPGLRWIMSDTLSSDWRDYVAERLTGGGDAALSGEVATPYGIPILKINLIPDDLPLTTTLEATSADVLGNRYGPFTTITAGVGQNNILKLDIDNLGVVTVTLTAGVLETIEIARQINAAFVADPAYGVAYNYVARDDGNGKLRLLSPTTGAASEVDVQAVANSAYATLGLTVAVTNGVNKGDPGVINDGTFIWLANPLNFVWGILDGTRIFTEFNKNYDRIETTVYNQVDAQVENLDAVVKAVSVRLRDLF